MQAPPVLDTPQVETDRALITGERLPGPNDLHVLTVFDVGACVGEYAGPAAVLWPAAYIHAFEPVARTGELFRAWRAAAGLDSRITLYQYALGEKDEDLEFAAMTSEPSTSSCLMPSRWLHARCPSVAAREVGLLRVRTLDSVVAQYGIQLHKDVVLKLDVQGTEDRVLRGARETLKHVRWIQLELCYDLFYEGQATLRSVLDVLEPLGFRFGGTVAQHGNIYSLGCMYGDLVFVRPGVA